MKSLIIFGKQGPIDPYKLLGVSRNATDEEIKRAQRKLAKQFHPDVNKAPDANQKFQDIQAAYDVHPSWAILFFFFFPFI